MDPKGLTMNAFGANGWSSIDPSLNVKLQQQQQQQQQQHHAIPHHQYSIRRKKRGSFLTNLV
ncbi:hypothetical protein NEUTE1DRAFT_43462 [Neurospora tetrasperma FGSC 2508]|uniref:Uncharacterized protein n=1 Tax=Neurospora tetrasperma (strain FGSC 2508 / ATCC MYA-4615 / P0657) TaxID=510951 RepID=F8MKK4_NEUT8|nr:uncharacterized protein NEUTE1DRAFT_43462 [Neurospora tetrasperma FGSC 2508]EGO57434.1 hypothetical protein NEUTE1DRAFT_43462 [Neurospora tetrasperma FGSC 2508]EGZ72308.1 hypothetical protein NEUTE2DRAFT_63708 [Neurospora tetrasperma FGSC 2509]